MVKYVTSSGLCLYLREGAGGLPDHPDNPQRDADHRGRSHEPADAIAPVRVGVHIVVLQRFVLNQEKQENSLQHTENHISLVNIIFIMRRELIHFTFFHAGECSDYCMWVIALWCVCDWVSSARLTAQMPGVRIIQHHLMKKTGL